MTPVEHIRWCIRECACFPAEWTVNWFMYGKRPFRDPVSAKNPMFADVAVFWCCVFAGLIAVAL